MIPHDLSLEGLNKNTKIWLFRGKYLNQRHPHPPNRKQEYQQSTAMVCGDVDWPESSVERRPTRNLHSPTHHLQRHYQQALGTFKCTFTDTSHFDSEKRISYMLRQGLLLSENNDTFHLDQCRSTFYCYDMMNFVNFIWADNRWHLKITKPCAAENYLLAVQFFFLGGKKERYVYWVIRQ